jgi:hypothetical protein
MVISLYLYRKHMLVELSLYILHEKTIIPKV